MDFAKRFVINAAYMIGILAMCFVVVPPLKRFLDSLMPPDAGLALVVILGVAAMAWASRR